MTRLALNTGVTLATRTALATLVSKCPFHFNDQKGFASVALRKGMATCAFRIAFALRRGVAAHALAEVSNACSLQT